MIRTLPRIDAFAPTLRQAKQGRRLHMFILHFATQDWPSRTSCQVQRLGWRRMSVHEKEEEGVTVVTTITLCRSSMTYLPLGFRSAMKGTRSLVAWKSSMHRSTPASCAIASRCSTCGVDGAGQAGCKPSRSRDQS